jgi:hypothetical protein
MMSLRKIYHQQFPVQQKILFIDQMANKYPSKYSQTTVSAAQYVTELICEKKALIEKKDLHYRFWLNNEWSKFFRNQIASANKLIKQYGDKAVVRALSNPKSKNIYSLRAPHLKPIIEYEKLQLESENTQLSKTIDRNPKTNFRQSTTSKNIISKIRDLDNGT